ncbi:MAG: flagellar export chaperone FliS [Acidimicrobiales bacterium]
MRSDDLRRRFQTDGMQSVSPERLVILLYERARRDLTEARAAIVARDHETRNRTLVHAQEIIEELAYSLQVDVWPGAERLLAIYDYLLRLLMKANIGSDLRPLDEAAKLIDDLTASWREAYVSIQPDTVTA